MMNVSLYLDVDGVICPFGATGATDWGSRWQISAAGLLEVAYAAELVASLNTLSRRPSLRSVGLPAGRRWRLNISARRSASQGRNGPSLPVTDRAAATKLVKLQALQRDIEASAPDRAVWIDDQLDYEAEARTWASIVGTRLLLISPHPRRGFPVRSWTPCVLSCGAGCFVLTALTRRSIGFQAPSEQHRMNFRQTPGKRCVRPGHGEVELLTVDSADWATGGNHLHGGAGNSAGTFFRLHQRLS